MSVGWGSSICLLLTATDRQQTTMDKLIRLLTQPHTAVSPAHMMLARIDIVSRGTGQLVTLRTSGSTLNGF